MAEMIKEIANRYHILSLVGQGGMADVYRARDTILNRVVAVKVLRSKLNEDPMTLVRFQREASAASRLSHPNVVDIYDVGEDEGMHYIVMEYVRGRTLKELIKQRGALNVTEAINIMKQLTSAVAHAHSHNIIHRDIKPQNVLVKDDGTVKITDFGIAVANDAVQLTLNNAVMGSAHYLAPETAEGKEPNPQVDIYSLGIVFYELLTGDVPFKGKTPTEIAIKHLRDKMPYVRDFNASIPQSVENIILKATARLPEERYQKAEDMLYDIQHCRDTENRNVERIVLTEKEVANVQIENGHVKVEYDQGKKKKRKLSSIILGVLIALIVSVLLFFGLAAAGIVHVDGLFGNVTMPDVIGMEEAEALEEIKKAEFSADHISTDYQVSDKYEAGQVIETSIRGGSVVPSDSDIVVTISKGPSYLIEDYTGLYLSDVLEEFQAEGVVLNIITEEEGAADTNPGVILQQKGLNPGDRIDPQANEEITFVISTYPSIVIPEDLIGKNVEEAKQELNELGIAVVTKQYGVSGNNVVISVSPDIGTEYTQRGSDTVVTLYYD